MIHEYDQPHVHEHVPTKTTGTTAASESALNGLLCVGDHEIRAEGNLIFISNSSGESGGFNPVLFEKCVIRFFNENF